MSANVAGHSFIDARKVTLTTIGPSATSFQVTGNCDMTDLFAYRPLSGLPLPEPTVARSADVQRGGGVEPSRAPVAGASPSTAPARWR